MAGSCDVSKVRQGLLELMTYLAAAAWGNVNEAPGYGPLRLLEGVQRVARLLSDLGIGEETLTAYDRRITQEGMKILADSDLAVALADQLLAELMSKIADATQA
jgi:hypothetical protein